MSVWLAAYSLAGFPFGSDCSLSESVAKKRSHK